MMIQELGARIAGEEIPELVTARSGEEQARWVLANILDWHRREEKPVWWEYLPPERIYGRGVTRRERGLSPSFPLSARPEDTDGKPVLRYRFPDQDTDLRGGEAMHIPGEGRFGTLAALHARDRTVDIRKPRKPVERHPQALFAHDHIRTNAQKDALARVGEHVADGGIRGDGPFGAARDLLLCQPPRTGGQPLRGAGEAALDAALRIAARPGFGVLPIQGPPGAGKTYTAARMICRLVENGARVGICANSHKVIRNLLDGVLVAAQEDGIDLRAVQKVSSPPNGRVDDFDGRLTVTTSNPAVFSALARDCQVAAGTAWLWARPEAESSIDVLFVDEAAQMSLANVLAISHAGPDLVLLGDPQQLDQPTQGSHPEGTELSALGHLLGERRTIDAEHGLFLEQTWRLHPDICDFTSEIFYEGKLEGAA